MNPLITSKLAVHLRPRLAARDLTIFYRAGWTMEDEASRLDRVRAIKAAQARFPRHRYIRGTLAHPHWDNGNYWDASYRRLSLAEGANLASIQYLLADIPVVSTPSIGGRDVFFTADCAAVATAVSKFKHERPPALAIRRQTLSKIQEFRHRFAEILTAQCGHAPVNEAWWRESTTHRPMAYQNLTRVADLLRTRS